MAKKDIFNKMINDTAKLQDKNYKEFKKLFEETFGEEDESTIESIKPEENKQKKETTAKCPNCGAPLKSYTSNCPYCNAEIKNTKPSKSLEEFTKGIEKIKSKEMPEYSGKESLLKKAIGIDLRKDIEAREEFETKFKNKINNEVANYINNYPVPNSKEDLIEFMILVTSNINLKNDDPEEIKSAWKSKMEQIYTKSKLTLKNPNDLKIVEDLYKSKKRELKSDKVDKVFYFLGYFCLLISLIIAIKNKIYCLSFIFLSLGVMTILYYIVNGEGTKLFKTPINLTKKLTKILLIVFLGLSLIFGTTGLIKDKIESKKYNDFLNNTTIPKNQVEVEIDFDQNLLLNRYDVKLNVYNEEINLPHGENKTFKLELSDGTHRLKFTGDGMVEYIDLKVKGQTKVKYNISCHTDEIKVTEVNIEYPEDLNNKPENVPNKEDEVKEESKKILVPKSSKEYENTNYKKTENELKTLGFKNIKTNKKETTDKNNVNENIAEITVNGKEFDLNSEFDENSEINIIYWILKEEPKKESVSYSTNDKDSVKDGDKGVYAYKNRGGEYSIYWIIDFDNGYVYNYFDGNGGENCDRVKIDSGSLNDYVKITWHDGKDKWSYGLYFKYRRQPDHLIVQDNDGFDFDFYSTNLNDALKVREKKTIKDY